MNCEIEFLPVGEASKAGDAIVIRYGQPNAYELMVIDGGTIDSGKALVEHVHSQFGPNSVVKHALLTHSDADHASGFREVLSGLPVQNVWLHIPWLSAFAALPYFADKRWTEDGLKKNLYNAFDLIAEIVKIALAKNIAIRQPFAGSSIGPFQVLSPHEAVYPALMAQFACTPEPDQKAIENVGLWIGKQPSFIAKMLEQVAAKIQKWVPESWTVERLKDGGITSANNESSVVLYGDFGSDRRVLLTGDAGIVALNLAANWADRSGFPLQQFNFVQVPHHGSRRNVGPTVLNRLLGPIQQQGTPSRFTAFVSAPKDDDAHPRKIVLNAFTRRGGNVVATQGSTKVYWGGFQPRSGYSSVDAIPLASQVEEYD